MIDTKRPNFQISTAPALCTRCSGIGSIWIYNKEHLCEKCKGSGLEPKKVKK